MHTHFRTFSRKFFEKNSPFTYSHCEKPNAHPISKNLSLHLFGIGKSKRTLFLRKNFEKYFLFGCGTAYFTYLKSPFTYLEFECKNATCLSEKTEKILKRLHVSKNLLTCSHWESVFGDGNSEKRQKNKLAGYGRHTFDTKN